MKLRHIVIYLFYFVSLLCYTNALFFTVVGKTCPSIIILACGVYRKTGFNQTCVFETKLPIFKAGKWKLCRGWDKVLSLSSLDMKFGRWLDSILDYLKCKFTPHLLKKWKTFDQTRFLAKMHQYWQLKMGTPQFSTNLCKNWKHYTQRSG